VDFSFSVVASGAYLVLAGATLLLVTVTLLQAWMAVRRRRADGAAGHEMIWTIIPALLVIVLSVMSGVAGSSSGMSTPSPIRGAK
jgi:heme/copper-type cytochrome/quinol oxidase subunit 2